MRAGMQFLTGAVALAVLLAVSTDGFNIEDDVVPESSVRFLEENPSNAKGHSGGDPETAFNQGDIHSKQIDTPSETLKLKICGTGHECTYKVELASTSSESNKDKDSTQSDELTQSYTLHVKPTGVIDDSTNSFLIDGSDYKVGGSDVNADADEFNQCFAYSTRHVTQQVDTGAVDLMEEHIEATEDSPCSQWAEKIQSIYAGTVEALAGAYAHAVDTELLEFSETVNVGNAKRTTQYRREEHTDGTMTIHRKHAWDAGQNSHPMPMLLQASDTSLGATATGKTHTNADGETDSAKDHVSANLGGGDSKAEFGCTGTGEEDANGQSCNNDEVPADKNEEQTVRLNSETDYSVTLVSSEVSANKLVQTMTKEEFLQFHAKAGRRPVPLLEAITVPEEAIEDPTDKQMDQGYDNFIQHMVKLGNTRPESFEPGKVREQVTSAMKSPKVRARMVRDLSQNKIKSARFVQSLMHAIGVAGTKQPQAIDQLIELASTHGIHEDAATQALVALLQAKCYDHDHAIQGLSKLARPNPQSHLEITALHIQHGLMAHADHCANHKYTDASAHKYQDILVQTRKHLTQAVASGDDASAWILMDAIGNTHSQHPAETAALVEVANDAHMTKQTGLEAVKNLGKLYTSEALVALKELASHPILDKTPLQKACEKAIAGEHLAKGDSRKPAIPQITSLVQGGNFGLDRSKVWSFPSTGDLRAEPKIGIEISKEDDYGGTDRNPLCLHGYAGVDGKAWSWTLSLIQAGARKCVGFKFYAYFSILSVTIWNKEKGSGLSNGNGVGSTGNAGQQLSTAGDSNGHCQTNVDAMDLTVVLSYDRDFLDADKSIWIGIFCLNGRIKLTGEVGLKCGWGNMGDPNSANPAAECRGGEILFAIPYAQATLTGELALDVLIAKGGAGVEVILVKFSLPSTNENMPATTSTAEKNCGGTYLKVESLGGKVYAFVDVMCGVSWFLERDWCRKYTVTIYEWSSPTDWTSNDVTCKDTGNPTPTTQASSSEAPATTATVSSEVSNSGTDQVADSPSFDEAAGTGAYAGQSPWVNAQKYPGRCGPSYENQKCGKGGTGCAHTHGVEVCQSFDCDQFKYCSSAGWCGRQTSYNYHTDMQCQGS